MRYARALASLMILIIGACKRAAPDEPSSTAAGGESAAATTTVERGPVKLTVTLDPPSPRLSDEPTLTITIDAKKGVKVLKPPFGEAVGDFSIVDYQEPLPEVREDREVTRLIYKLEPLRTGEVTIAPVPVEFEDHTEGGDSERHTIESEAVTVKVTSMVEGEAPRLDQLAPRAGPLPLPAERRIPWQIVVAAILAAGVVASWIWRRRRRQAPSGRALSPAELAYLELQRLLQDDPLGRGELQTFYVELTLIVRRFIERTTGIRAPEQTTEEFLRAMQAHAGFEPEERSRLRSFLESADLVKFAAFRPTADEIEASFQRAKEFVAEKRGEAVSGRVAEAVA
ncbi:MAG: BatD family protein [Planctomycetota bacterium]